MYASTYASTCTIPIKTPSSKSEPPENGESQGRASLVANFSKAPFLAGAMGIVKSLWIHCLHGQAILTWDSILQAIRTQTSRNKVSKSGRTFHLPSQQELSIPTDPTHPHKHLAPTPQTRRLRRPREPFSPGPAVSPFSPPWLSGSSR